MSKKNKKDNKQKTDYSRPKIPIVSKREYNFSEDPTVEYRPEKSADVEIVKDNIGLSLKYKRRYDKKSDGTWIPRDKFILSVYSWINRPLSIMLKNDEQIIQHKDHILRFTTPIKSKETANWIWSLVVRRGATFEHLKDILAPRYLEEVFEIEP